jgi:hypothetical protein
MPEDPAGTEQERTELQRLRAETVLLRAQVEANRGAAEGPSAAVGRMALLVALAIIEFLARPPQPAPEISTTHP